jgi:hypothetical protein
MQENELMRKLNSVGKAAFVEHYETFRSYAENQTSREECINILVSKKVSNDSGAGIRAGNAKLIFQAKMEREALKIITGSNRMPFNIIDKARKLLN